MFSLMTDVITTCGGTVTLNNTYWQSPTTAVSAPSTCALTVRMDTKLVEQLENLFVIFGMNFQKKYQKMFRTSE